MSGADLIARAKTGSGKTLAFAIPVIEKILAAQEPGARRQRLPQCLVLAPTRELAKQVRSPAGPEPPPLPSLLPSLLCVLETGSTILGHSSP